MTNNKQRSAVVRKYIDDNPGTSFTKASFAVRDAQTAAAERASDETTSTALRTEAAPEGAIQPAELLYLGCHVRLSGPRRRTVTGVVLPPAPRSRSGALRLVVEGRAKPARFTVTGYEVTVLAGPHYDAGNLPAALLATRTMLKAEDRRKPAEGQEPIADYTVHTRGRRGVFDLYARIDTVEMRELPSAQQEAWTAARTCERCGTRKGRPIHPVSPEGNRYCVTCHRELAAERWITDAAGPQNEAAAWAAEVLNDSKVVLVESSRVIGGEHIRAEMASGELVLDAVVRYADDLDHATRLARSPEEREQWMCQYEGTVGPSEVIPQAEIIAAGRPLMFYGHAGVPVLRDFEVLPSKWMPRGDEISVRFSIWRARANERYAYWQPTPNVEKWHGGTSGPLSEAYHEAERDDLVGRIAALRAMLRTMATDQPPTPSVGFLW